MTHDRPARNATVCLLLLALQTAAGSVVVWDMFPIFQAVVRNIGRPQPLPGTTVVIAIAATLMMQACYWVRYACVPLTVPVRGAVLGHLVLFASRASFFFAAALFSAFFFRHVPQLDVLPPAGQSLVKALGMMLLLFALYCYSLELERIGKAMEERPPRPKPVAPSAA